MKTCVKNLFLMPALIAGLGWIQANRVTAQTFTVVHDLTDNEGDSPWAGLILSSNTLYGAATSGGFGGNGTLFAVSTDGTGFTNLHSFAIDISSLTNSDGAYPFGGLVLSCNTLYGTAQQGGSANKGAVFAINTDGSGFTNLHNFIGGSDGATPRTGLILSSHTLYGAASAGGSSNAGVLFKFNADGTGFTNFYSFTGGDDGAAPIMYGGLILSNNTLYGTTSGGGAWGSGTVFKVNTDGSGFTNLYSFSAGVHDPFSSFGNITNSDGANPYGGLVLSGNTLYGTAAFGGSSAGTLFKVNTDSSGFTNIYTFNEGGYNDLVSNQTNSDGANPVAGLIMSGNTLYGTAVQGGNSGAGTVFAINTDGTGFTNLHSFTALSQPPFNGTNSDGAYPRAGLILSCNTLYGTAVKGGLGRGTVFSLSLPQPPKLTIYRYGTNIILTWQTNVSGFTLQSTTNLVSPVVWTTNSPAPVVVNGQNTVTNPITGVQQFYRLSQ